MSPLALIFCISCLFTFNCLVASAYQPSDFPTRDLEPFVTRPPFCSGLTFRGLPNATVVITVLNEHPSMIETNVRAILSKTPPELLDSIIIVDDYSEVVPVPDSLLVYPKVKIVRTDSPKGVAGARMVGAKEGKGAVLIFLDAQMEVTERWIEPLLGYVASHPRAVATSVIDVMSEEDNSYRTAVVALVSLVLEDLTFRWTTPVDPSLTNNNLPYVLYTPVLLGSAFAITRKWFDDGGRYDPENRVWGIENIELSVRVWTCGGHIVALPCSHIGHYFRNERKIKSPRFDSTLFLFRNGIRFAEVWMDEHAERYFSNLRLEPDWIEQERSSPDLEERKQLRQQMQCKPFSWYYNIILKGILDLYKVEVPGVPHNITLVDTLTTTSRYSPWP